MYTKKILPALNQMKSMVQSLGSKQNQNTIMELRFKFSEKIKEFFETQEIGINEKMQRLTNAFNC